MKNLAFIIALFGILILFLIINTLEPKIIESIENKDLNKKVKIQGISNNIKVHENNFTTFEINNMKIICNCPNIENNQKLEIIGRVSEFNNELQIEADKITLINTDT